MSTKTYTTDRAWSNYWEAGFESTFARHEDSEFFQELDAEWRSLFSALDTGAHVVDLAAGNGTVALSALAVSEENNKELRITAIDYAEVEDSSALAKKSGNISLKSRTKIEHTGLDANSVDLAVSQYGFEYAEHAGAAAELSRILKPGGKFHAIVHHRQSEVAQSCVSSHQQIGLCYRSKLSEHTRKLLKRIRKLEKSHRDPQVDMTAIALRQEFNKRVDRVYQYAEKLPDMVYVTSYLHEITSLFGPKAKDLDFGRKMEILDQLEDNAKNYQLRMEAMLEASLDSEGVQALVEHLRQAGLRVESPTEVTHDFKTYAWRIEAQKPTA